MTELIDRYLWAVTRTLPVARRAEVSAGLRTSIDEEVAAKVKAGADAATAEIDTLAEFGDPDRRAAEFSGRPADLIGPAYFFDYRRLLIILLSAVTPSVFGAMVLAQWLAGNNNVTGVGIAFSTALTVAFQLLFWVTVVFAIIERTARGKGRAFDSWHPASLPQLPTNGRIGVGETVPPIMANLFLIGFIFWQQNFTVVQTLGGEQTAIFSPALWSFWLPYFITIAVLEIGFAMLGYGLGHWNWTLAGINVVLAAGFAVPACWLFVAGDVFNPVFMDRFVNTMAPLGTVLSLIPVLIGVLALLDMVDGFRRAYARVSRSRG